MPGRTGGASAATATSINIFDVTTYGAKMDGSTDDSAAIQAAIDACSAAGGGIVEISGSEQIQGTGAGHRIKINTPLVMRSSVHLRGRGPQTSLTGTADPFIKLPTSGVVPDRITISDLFLQSPPGDGILLDYAGVTGGLQLGWLRLTIENITVADAVGDAFKVPYGAPIETRFINCVSLRAGGHGFDVSSTDEMFIGCTAAQGAHNGFSVGGANNKFSACKAYGNAQSGFDLAGAGRHVLAGCETQDNHIGYEIVSSWNTVQGLSDTDDLYGVSITGTDNTVTVTSMYGGGGSGAVTDVGFFFQVGALRNNVRGTSNATSAIGGQHAGNSVSVGADRGLQTITYAATITPDLYKGATCRVTLTGDIVINAPALPVSRRVTFIFVQDATGGRAVTFDAAYRTTAAIPTTASTIGTITFEYDGRYWLEVHRSAGLTQTGAITDSFTRADAVTLGVADTGQSWVNVRGGAQIVSNEARAGGTGFSNFNDNVIVVESSLADCTITAKMPGGAGASGISFRVVDNNNYWAVENQRLVKRIAGSQIAVHSAGFIDGFSAGDTLGVILSGPTITVTRNGAAEYSETDTDLVTATKHGLYFSDTGGRADDFSIT